MCLWCNYLFFLWKKESSVRISGFSQVFFTNRFALEHILYIPDFTSHYLFLLPLYTDEHSYVTANMRDAFHTFLKTRALKAIADFLYIACGWSFVQKLPLHNEKWKLQLVICTTMRTPCMKHELLIRRSDHGLYHRWTICKHLLSPEFEMNYRR